MILRFQNHVVDFVELDNVPAAPAVVDANGGSGHVVHHIVADGGMFADRSEYGRRLLPKHAAVVHQIIRDDALHGEGTIAANIPVPGPDQANRALTGLGKLVSVDAGALVVIADEDPIPADRIEEAVLDRAVLGAFQNKSSAAIKRPVAMRRRLVFLEKRAGSVGDPEAAEAQVRDRLALAATNFDKMLQMGRLEEAG